VLYRAGGKQRKAYVPTLKAAQAKRAEVTVDLQRGEWQAPSKVRLGAYLTEWVESSTRPSRRAALCAHAGPVAAKVGKQRGRGPRSGEVVCRV
jgi:hypothetical protein